MSRIVTPYLAHPTRRSFLSGIGATGLATATVGAHSRLAFAQQSVVRCYGTTTAAMRDWTPFNEATQLSIEFTPHDGDIASFMREIIANEIGNQVDFYIFEGGPEDQLGPQGYYLQVDENHPELTLWARTSDDYKRSALMQDAGGVQYGIPVMNNADCFGYRMEVIGVTDPTTEVSWELVFESEQTRGHVALDNQFDITMPETANWLEISGQDTFGDATNPTPEEAKRIADYLISRKRAGQFRTFFASYDEQVQLLHSREVDVINCWEPVVKDVNRLAGEEVIAYAFTEFYNKWGQGIFIAAPEKDGATVSNIYKAANYFLGGEYAAYRAVDRGYGGPNIDLGVEYAINAGWSEGDVDLIRQVQAKVDRKYRAERSWYRRLPDHREVMEEEFQRFLNA